MCRGIMVPIGHRHTLLPEPTEKDKELIAVAHKKIVAAQKLDKAWPGALITDQGDHLFFRFNISPPSSPIDTPLSDIRCALRAAGWDIVDPTVEPDCVSGRLQQIEVATTPQNVPE